MHIKQSSATPLFYISMVRAFVKVDRPNTGPHKFTKWDHIQRHIPNGILEIENGNGNLADKTNLIIKIKSLNSVLCIVQRHNCTSAFTKQSVT